MSYRFEQDLRKKSELPQRARKSAAKSAPVRAPLTLTVSIDLSASDGEQDEIRDFGAVWTLSDPVVQLRAEAEKEEVEENYGGLVIALWDFALTLFLAPSHPIRTCTP